MYNIGADGLVAEQRVRITKVLGSSLRVNFSFFKNVIVESL